VVKTTDGGATWQTQNVGLYDMLNSVYFTDNNNGYAVGAAGTALRTTDGGTNWTPMTVPDAGNLTKVQFPENGLVGYIGLQPQAGGGRILKTIDGGDNWAVIGVGGPFVTSYSCGMATDNQGVVVGYEGWVYGVPSDTAHDSQTTADIVAAAFSHDDPDRGYLIGNDSTQGVIRYTATFGPVWDSVTCPVVSALWGVDMPTSDIAYFCGTDGFIGKTLAPTYVQSRYVPPGVTATMCGVCFPNGADTGYAVGAGGVILRTYDGGGVPGIADARAPVAGRAGIRVVSNPSRCGITFRTDANVIVAVFDAAGRVVARQAATKGLNFLSLSEAGAYFVKAGAQTFRVVLTE
jgi:photosystem II stability/assembly factor-like uncharacterized protein